jgi:tRNA G18 (ribose-2'-O)-methylase SpoU
VVLGHESDGIPVEATALLDRAMEIPMVGTGLSLNVAVAGFLVWRSTNSEPEADECPRHRCRIH